MADEKKPDTTSKQPPKQPDPRDTPENWFQRTQVPPVQKRTTSDDE